MAQYKHSFAAKNILLLFKNDNFQDVSAWITQDSCILPHVHISLHSHPHIQEPTNTILRFDGLALQFSTIIFKQISLHEEKWYG